MVLGLSIIVLFASALSVSANRSNPVRRCFGCDNESGSYICLGPSAAECVCQTTFAVLPISCNSDCCRSTTICCGGEAYGGEAYGCHYKNKKCYCLDDGSFCDAASCCPGSGNRRALLQSAEFVHESAEEVFEEMAEGCENSQFETFLYVQDGHFYGVVTPVADSVPQCFSMAGHVWFGEDTGDAPAEKQILAWSTPMAFEQFFDRDKALWIGTFAGHQLAKAFESSSPSSDSKPGYDALMNNCADFLLNMAKSLEVPVDSQVAGYVARRLVEDSGSQLVEYLRDSALFRLFLQDTPRHLRREEENDPGFSFDDMSDVETVGLFVQARAGDLL